MVKESKVSEAKRRADKKYREANRDKRKRSAAKSASKKFVKEYATREELEELSEMIKKRKSNL